MISEVRHNEVQGAPLESESRVTLGAGTMLAPASEFLFEVGDTWLQSVELPALPRAEGQPGVATLLDEIAGAARERAVRLGEAGAAWRQVGAASLAAGDTEGARDAFQRALKSQPSDRNARLGLARTAFEEGQTAEAKSILESMLVEEPADVDLRVYLALVMAAAGDFSAALRCVEGQAPRAEGAATYLGARGGIRFALKDVKGAISDLRKATRLRPDWVHVRSLLAQSELRLGRTGAAERHLREAVRIAPMNLASHEHLARLLVIQEKWHDVLTHVEAFWDPEYAPFELAHAAGFAGLKLGEVRSARRWLESAVAKAETDEDSAIALNNLGVVYTRLNQTSKAAAAFEQSVARQPTVVAQANRAKLFLDEGQAAEAIEWVGERGLLEGGQVDVEIARTIAVALMQLGRYEEAVSIAKRCLAAASADVDSFVLLSGLYADATEDYDAAISVALEGLTVSPRDPSLTNNLAYAQLLSGRVDQAAETLEALDESGLERELLVYVASTRGLLALWRGDLADGTKLYDEAASFAGRDSLRARVRSKRDLETARAMVRLGRPVQDVRRLLERAQKGGRKADPYSRQASRELKLLPSGSK